MHADKARDGLFRVKNSHQARIGPEKRRPASLNQPRRQSCKNPNARCTAAAPPLSSAFCRAVILVCFESASVGHSCPTERTRMVRRDKNVPHSPFEADKNDGPAKSRG